MDSLAGQDVLIIDHDPPTIKLVTVYLKSRGYRCKGFRSGKEGIANLQSISPKFILIDPILPDIDGFVLCEMIKSFRNLNHIPIYFFTTLPIQVIEKKIVNSHAEGYILKPFDLKDLNILLK